MPKRRCTAGNDPMYAFAYVGKLMSEMQVSEIDDLKACDFDVDNNGNFKNALRCSDGELKQQLILLKSTINERCTCPCEQVTAIQILKTLFLKSNMMVKVPFLISWFV